MRIHRIGQTYTYTILYRDCFQDVENKIDGEVVAVMADFPTIYRLVKKEQKLILEEATLMTEIPEVDIIKASINAFNELKDKYIKL